MWSVYKPNTHASEKPSHSKVLGKRSCVEEKGKRRVKMEEFKSDSISMVWTRRSCFGRGKPFLIREANIIL